MKASGLKEDEIIGRVRVFLTYFYIPVNSLIDMRD
jgi:hypothetical protein